MRNKFWIFIILALVIGCSEEKSDEYLLAQDRKRLEESCYTANVLLYKYIKIGIRASALKDTTFPELEELNRVNELLAELGDTNSTEIKPVEYYKMAVAYWNLRSYVRETDEDIFPTLEEAMNDSLPPNYVFLSGEEKARVQNTEHAILGIGSFIFRDFGTDVSMYECFKVNPQLFPEGEERALFQFVRSFMFMSKGLYYLSEYELSDNIKWLNANTDIDLPFVQLYFFWTMLQNGESGYEAVKALQTTDEQNYLIFHSLNHLTRGIDRLMMEREIDEKRAIEDFEAFIEDAHKLGVNNELVWCIEAYLALKKEDSDRAIRALTNLKSSPILNDDERETIDEAIAYLEEREPGKVLNGVYDKYFLSKIVVKFTYYQMKKVDWKQVLKDSGVENVDERFEKIENMNKLWEEMEQYTEKEKLIETGEELKEKGKELQEEGGKLLDKAKDWWSDDEEEK